MTPEVEAGAKLLDEAHPGWFNEINLDILDLSDCSTCVLGQLYGHFADGISRLGLREDYSDSFYSGEGKEHGFNVKGPASLCLSLTPHWREAIMERRNPLTVNEILQAAPLVAV